jgi:hypothetical protein
MWKTHAPRDIGDRCGTRRVFTTEDAESTEISGMKPDGGFGHGRRDTASSRCGCSRKRHPPTRKARARRAFFFISI